MKLSTCNIFCLILVMFLSAWLFAPTANADDIIITEIMYNPASNEGNYRDGIPSQVEWIEIHNLGKNKVDLTNWYLQDEDGPTGKFPKDSNIDPGETVVLIPSECSEKQFHEAWGEKINIIRVERWSSGLHGLANSPSETNEILQLRNSKFKLVDEVNYDDIGDWPRDTPQGPSIYLLPSKYSAEDNGNGKNWARSKAEKHGGKNAVTTDIFDSKDVGSPGITHP